MENVNKVIVSGNITKDPELRQTTNGTSVLCFGIACNESVKKGDAWENYPNFFDCVLYGKRADGLSSFLAKGMKVCVSGKLHYSSWERDGQFRSKVEIICDCVDVCSKKNEPNNNQNNSDDGIPF